MAGILAEIKFGGLLSFREKLKLGEACAHASLLTCAPAILSMHM